MIMELIIILILLFTSTSTTQAFDYDHMEMVIQWPPTYCGMANINCNPALSKLKFTIHGLWPGDARGNTRQTCPPPPDPTAVRQVWVTDNKLKHELDLYWPTYDAGRTNESFWMHEWQVHGYCTKDTVSAAEYFRAATRFGKIPYTMLAMLINHQKPPKNDRTYNIEDIKTLISTEVVGNKKYEVYVSCKPANESYIFLHEIHLCLDKTLKAFISCPRSTDTRGCGGPDKKAKLIFPTRAIYR